MKKYFQQFSLNFINLFGMLIVFFFAMIFTFLLIFEEYRDFEQESVMLKENYIKKQKQKAKDETERVLNYVKYIYSTMQTQINETQLQESVVNSIEHLFDRKNGSNYIFIYTLDGINISDPNKPGNRGKNIIDLQDINGKLIVKELIEKAQKGGGYVQYVWANPANSVFSEKISYAETFKPWNWLIGTGVYLNEIDMIIAENKIKLKERLIKYMMEILTLSAILFWFAFAGMKLINTVIRNEISTFRDFFQKSVTHNIVIDKRQIHIKEFQILVEYVNEMVSSIHQRNHELEELNASLEEKVVLKTAKLHKQMEYNKQLVKAQDSFIKHSIHEINTPLAVILTNIDIYKMKYGENNYLSKIEAATKMLSNIYDDLGYMIKKNRIDYVKEKLDFSLFLHERIDFFKEVAVANGHMIHFEIEEDNMLYFNRIELERVVDNNLSNAIKYAKKSTDILIRLYRKEDQTILKFLTYSKKIQDTKQIFEAFHQEEHLEGGFGLGLEIVGMICKKEGIKIEVDSTDTLTSFIYYFKGSGSR